MARCSRSERSRIKSGCSRSSRSSAAMSPATMADPRLRTWTPASSAGQRFELGHELRPTEEPGPGKHELRIGQRTRRRSGTARAFFCANRSIRSARGLDLLSLRSASAIPGVRRALDPLECPVRIAAASPARQALTRSFASFLDCSRLGRGGRGSASCGLGTYESPSSRAWSPHGQAERRFVSSSELWVGTALSADWMRPSRNVSICPATGRREP